MSKTPQIATNPLDLVPLKKAAVILHASLLPLVYSRHGLTTGPISRGHRAPVPPIAASENERLSDVRALQEEVTSLRKEVRQTQRGAAVLVHLVVDALTQTRALSPKDLLLGIEIGLGQAEASPDHPVLRMAADLLAEMRGMDEVADALAG